MISAYIARMLLHAGGIVKRTPGRWAHHFRPAASRVGSALVAMPQQMLIRALVAGALAIPGPAAADNGIGGWSTLAGWPLIPIHAVLLGDGRVMTYGTNASGQAAGNFIYDVWDPRLGRGSASHLTLPNTVGTNLFCNAQLVLPGSGQVFMAGGDIWNGTRSIHRGNAHSVLFDPNRNELTQESDMKRLRYYATVTTLANGETYIQGGLDGEDRPEVRSASGEFRLLTGANTSELYWWYPRGWLARDGRVFGYSDRAMYYVNPTANGGDGSLVSAGSMPASGPSGATSSEVMYAPGKILRVGGGGLNNIATETGKRAALIIDINGSSPSLRSATAMPLALHWATATVIADGRVVVTGGSLKSNQLVGVSTRALIWNPGTDRWTQSRPGSGKSRLYHSIALLLPDATVLVGGGGAPGPQKISTQRSTIHLTSIRRLVHSLKDRGSRLPRRGYLSAASSASASREHRRSGASPSSRRARSRTASTWNSASWRCRSPKTAPPCRSPRPRAATWRRRACTCCSSSTPRACPRWHGWCRSPRRRERRLRPITAWVTSR